MIRDWRSDDFSWVRGANYVPTYAANDVVQWRRYQSQVVERELAFARRLGLNSVRTFLNILPYEEDRDGFIRSYEHFLATAHANGLSAMVVVWNSCFGGEPDIDATDYWVPNPGNRFLGEKHWSRLEKYIYDVVGRYERDERILIWDVMNEPLAAGAFARKEENRRIIWKFAEHFCSHIKALDGTHPITVGVYETDHIPFIEEHIDIISRHVYRGKPETQRKIYSDLKEAGKRTGKAILVSEIASYATGQTYRRALEGAEEAGVGWYLFELTIGVDLFCETQGIFYPDGTVRDINEAGVVAGFREKSMREGVRTLFTYDPEDFTDLVAEAAATRATARNIERKLRLLHSYNTRVLVERAVCAERGMAPDSLAVPVNAEQEENAESRRRELAEIRQAVKKRMDALWQPAWDAYFEGNTEAACGHTDVAIGSLLSLARAWAAG
jgi:hypothetical protein